MTDKIITLFDNVLSLTLLETRRFVSHVEIFFGISTAIANSIVVTSQEDPTALEIVEEKTLFDIILTTVPADNKLSVLKLVRSITSLGLKESKEIVDNVPKLIKESLTKGEADEIKKQFENIGASVVIK